MAFCMRCGSPADKGTRCPVCGDMLKKPSLFRFGLDCGGPLLEEPCAERDIADNRMMAALAYLGPLCWIPFLAAQRSPFARAHAMQGMCLLLLEAAYLLGTGLLNALFALIAPALAIVGSAIFAMGFLAFVALSVLGLRQTRRGEARRLPIIGELPWMQ